MIKLRGNRFGVINSPEEILTLVENIGEVYGLSSPELRQYYIWDWTTMRQINWNSLGSIRKYLGALRREGLQPFIPSRCGADHIRVKNHYLGFYPEQESIIKAFLDEDSYHRHIKGIQRFSEFGFHQLAAPELQGFDVKPSPHTLESHIFGKNYQMIPLDLGADLIKELAEFHFNQPREIDVIIGEDDKKQIIEGLNENHLERIDITRIQSLLDRSSWRIIEGEIHGDLNRSNLISGKETVYLTDWEFFSRGPIAQDLVKLYFQANDIIRQRIINTYQNKQNKISGGDQIVDFKTSLLLYSIKAYQDLLQQPAGKHIYLTGDPAIVEKKTALLQKNLLDSIQSLVVGNEK